MFRSKVRCPSGRYWRVKPGDTLSRIARETGTTVAALRRLNPGIDANNLRVGQQICLPAEPACPSGIFWEVAPGDTFYRIARRTGTSVRRLISLNPHLDPNNLQVGQKVCLPK
ncbi:MAG: LysM peptidoglycan-binding domain-containing protein [Clostridia bacterium]|jgi:LysM repeat protein|nr:LysM peptidoglycan-binding domain-containing protein [Clostridia bacterium]